MSSKQRRFPGVWALVIVVLNSAQFVSPNAMLTPSHRGLLWAKTNHETTNYNYMEIKCGGLGTLKRNHGECGLCGDPYDGVRQHETGGKYSTGAIANTYGNGERTIKVKILLNSDQGGYFIFHLCEANRRPETQECFDKHFLMVTEGRWQGDEYAYIVQRAGVVHLTLEIPEGLSCSHCVLQWKYMTSNTWGRDPDGTGCLGCGIQEQYVNCADIKIEGWGNITQSPPSTTTPPPPPPPPPRSTKATKTAPPPPAPRHQGYTTRKRVTDKDEGTRRNGNGDNGKKNRIPEPPKARPYTRPSAVTLVVEPAIPPPNHATTTKRATVGPEPSPPPQLPQLPQLPQPVPVGPNKIPRPPPLSDLPPAQPVGGTTEVITQHGADTITANSKANPDNGGNQLPASVSQDNGFNPYLPIGWGSDNGFSPAQDNGLGKNNGFNPFSPQDAIRNNGHDYAGNSNTNIGTGAPDPVADQSASHANAQTVQQTGGQQQTNGKKSFNLLNEYAMDSSLNPSFDKRMQGLSNGPEYVSDPSGSPTSNNIPWERTVNLRQEYQSYTERHIQTQNLDRTVNRQEHGGSHAMASQQKTRYNISPFDNPSLELTKSSATSESTKFQIRNNGIPDNNSPAVDSSFGQQRFGEFLSPLNKRLYMVDSYSNSQNHQNDVMSTPTVSESPRQIHTATDMQTGSPFQRIRQRDNRNKQRINTEAEFVRPVITERFTNFRIGNTNKNDPQVNTSAQNEPQARDPLPFTGSFGFKQMPERYSPSAYPSTYHKVNQGFNIIQQKKRFIEQNQTFSGQQDQPYQQVQKSQKNLQQTNQQNHLLQQSGQQSSQHGQSFQQNSQRAFQQAKQSQQSQHQSYQLGQSLQQNWQHAFQQAQPSQPSGPQFHKQGQLPQLNWQQSYQQIQPLQQSWPQSNQHILSQQSGQQSHQRVQTIQQQDTNVQQTQYQSNHNGQKSYINEQRPSLNIQESNVNVREPLHGKVFEKSPDVQRVQNSQSLTMSGKLFPYNNQLIQMGRLFPQAGQTRQEQQQTLQSNQGVLSEQRGGSAKANKNSEIFLGNHWNQWLNQNTNTMQTNGKLVGRNAQDFQKGYTIITYNNQTDTLPTSKMPEKPTLLAPKLRQTTPMFTINMYRNDPVAKPTLKPSLASPEKTDLQIQEMRRRMLEKIRRANERQTGNSGTETPVKQEHEIAGTLGKTTLRNEKQVLQAFQKSVAKNKLNVKLTNNANNYLLTEANVKGPNAITKTSDKKSAERKAVADTKVGTLSKPLGKVSPGFFSTVVSEPKVKIFFQTTQLQLAPNAGKSYTTQKMSKPYLKLPLPELTTKSFIESKQVGAASGVNKGDHNTAPPADFVKSTVKMFVDRLTRKMEEQIRYERATGKVKTMPLSKQAIFSVLRKMAMSALLQNKTASAAVGAMNKWLRARPKPAQNTATPALMEVNVKNIKSVQRLNADPTPSSGNDVQPTLQEKTVIGENNQPFQAMANTAVRHQFDTVGSNIPAPKRPSHIINIPNNARPAHIPPVRPSHLGKIGALSGGMVEMRGNNRPTHIRQHPNNHRPTVFNNHGGTFQQFFQSAQALAQEYARENTARHRLQQSGSSIG